MAHHHSLQGLGAGGASRAGTSLRPPGCVGISSGLQRDGSVHPIVYKKNTESWEELKEELQK